MIFEAARKPIVVAHRGASGECPENALAAFRRAIELGADFFETDVRLSRDGVPVLMHDAAVDRTTDGTGPIAGLSLEEIKRLDAGSWKAPQFAGERVPTLAEALDLARGRIRVNIEIKDPAAAEPVVVAVHAAAMDNQVVVLCFDDHVLSRVRALAPDLARMVLVSSRAPGYPPAGEIIRRCRAVGAAAMGVQHDGASADLIEAAHAAGIAVLFWTVNDPERMRELIALGADVVASDWPEVALRVRSEE